MTAHAAKVLISGRVQGVFFRYWTREQAAALGVRGWVRNCYGGAVEAHFEGPREAVEALIARCYGGPPSALVKAVEVEPVEPSGISGFEVRPSA